MCSLVSNFGTRLVHISWKRSLLYMISNAEPWLIYIWVATSSMTTHQFIKIMVRTRSMLLSVVDVDGHPAPSLCITLTQPFLNFSIDLYTHCCGKTLCWKPSMDFCPLHTFDPQKPNHWLLLFFDAKREWSRHVNLTRTETELTP